MLDNLHPYSMRASQWSPPRLQFSKEKPASVSFGIQAICPKFQTGENAVLGQWPYSQTTKEVTS